MENMSSGRKYQVFWTLGDALLAHVTADPKFSRKQTI